MTKDGAVQDPVAAYLQSLPSKPGIDLSFDSLDRVCAVLERLGNPQDKTAPVVHLAGTNGKGSTLANLRAMAEADGRRVHCLTSPHMVNTREQVRLAGRLIEDDQLIDYLGRVHTIADDIPLTPFELMTIAAFLTFSENSADLVLLETGLGGRLDATNVVKEPILQVITPISFDHQEFLGSSLAKITREKAGIFRKDGLAVIAPQTDVVRLELGKAADAIGCRLMVSGHDWRYKVSGSNLLVVDGESGFTGPLPVLEGDHQIMNAATAIVAARAMGADRIPDSAIKAGLGWVRWPGRLQNLTESPLAIDLTNGSEVWLDGGHNPSAGDVLSSFLKKQDPVDLSVTLICSMKAVKDSSAFLRQFTGLIDQCITVPLWQDPSGYAPADLAAEGSRMGLKSVIARDLAGALDRVRAEKPVGQRQLVLIAGSLRLAGEALSLAGLEPR